MIIRTFAAARRKTKLPGGKFAPMKILKISGLSMLALVLVFGVASPVLATPDQTPPQIFNLPPKTLVGKVIEVNESQKYFILQQGEREVTISVDNATRYVRFSPPQKLATLAREGLKLKERIQERLEGELERHRAELRQQIRQRLEQALPENRAGLKERIMERLGQALPSPHVEIEQPRVETIRQWGLRQAHIFTEEATFDDILNARVIARVVPNGDNPLAKLVIILEPTAYHQVIGTVIGISPADKTITIALADGSDELALEYNDNTRFILHGIISLEEQPVRAIYDEEGIIIQLFAPIEVPESTD